VAARKRERRQVLKAGLHIGTGIEQHRHDCNLPIRIRAQWEYENEDLGSCAGSFLDIGAQPDEAVDSRDIQAVTGGVQQTDAPSQRIDVDTLRHKPDNIVLASFKRRG
jgi:hypothetical protein